MLIGYARVSTNAQDTALQLDALSHAGVRQVFEDSGSGVGPRLELQRAIAALRPGNTLVVWKIDRAARSLSDLLNILSRIKAVGASIRSLTEPIDTSTPIGEFTFQILGAVAQLERSMIRERVMAGQAAAKARGKRWGTPPGLPYDQEDLLCGWFAEGGELSRTLRVILVCSLALQSGLLQVGFRLLYLALRVGLKRVRKYSAALFSSALPHTNASSGCRSLSISANTLIGSICAAVAR